MSCARSRQAKGRFYTTRWSRHGSPWQNNTECPPRHPGWMTDDHIAFPPREQKYAPPASCSGDSRTTGHPHPVKHAPDDRSPVLAMRLQRRTRPDPRFTHGDSRSISKRAPIKHGAACLPCLSSSKTPPPTPTENGVKHNRPSDTFLWMQTTKFPHPSAGFTQPTFSPNSPGISQPSRADALCRALRFKSLRTKGLTPSTARSRHRA